MSRPETDASDNGRNTRPEEARAAAPGSPAGGPAGDATGPAGGEEEALLREVARLKEESAFYLDQLARSRADFDNYRRRTAAERDTIARRVTTRLFREVLPIYDGLERAIAAHEGGAAPPGMGGVIAGLRALADSFSKILESNNVRRIESVGQPFDPTVHEAVWEEATDAVPPGTVLEELESGYQCGEDLLRPARVKVARAAAAPATE